MYPEEKNTKTLSKGGTVGIVSSKIYTTDRYMIIDIEQMYYVVRT